MHLEAKDSKTRERYKVWLENKGRRVFEPVGRIPAKVLKSLQLVVEERRVGIEDDWVQFMLDHNWLSLYVNMPVVTLVAYPHHPEGRFTRKIDLSTWGLNQEQFALLGPKNITLHRQMSALRLWADRPEEQTPFDARLSRLLWTG